MILMFALAACGGSGGTTGVGGSGGAGGSSGTGGAAGGGGTTGTGGTGGVACGGVACGSNQVCAHPSCGGGVAVCIPLGDAGQCAAGFTMTDQCSPGSGPGCIPPPCDPPPPRCVDVPPACLGAPSCSCLPSNVCQQPNGQFGGSCANVSNGSVLCLSA
ncbi:MAG TPA: hypothetical protein VKQ32_16590 [Polyangia bacterium]|nr:hypothetical protein [Polyangia bacterium]